jgi:hypothetical protein
MSGTITDDCMDAGGSVMSGTITDDCMDAGRYDSTDGGGRATQEQLPSVMSGTITEEK